VKWRDADVEKIADEAAKRGCAEAVAQRGARAPADCITVARAQVLGWVYDVFKKCAGNEACVRGKFENEVLVHLRYFLADSRHGSSGIGYSRELDYATTQVIDQFLWLTCRNESFAARLNGGIAGLAAWDKAFHAERYGGSSLTACAKTFEGVYAPRVTSTVKSCFASGKQEDPVYACIDAILQPLGKDLLKAIRAIFPPFPVKK